MAGETACPVGLPVPLSVSCWKAGDKIAGAHILWYVCK